MLATRNPTLALLISIGLLLLPVLASVRGIPSRSVHPKDLDARETLPSLELTGDPSADDVRRRGILPETGRSLASWRAGDVAWDSGASSRLLEGREEGSPMLQPRGPEFLGRLKFEESGLKLPRSSPAATSAAPKVFGVSIYLVIAWVVLIYLMFRTGSMF